MKLLAKRVTLIDQVAQILETEIARGAWKEWLPNERALAEEINVSRNTLRAALGQLKARKIIKSIHPIGTRIIGSTPQAVQRKHEKIIGLLSLTPINLLRPNVALIIDELRGQLAEIGFRLHIYHGERYLNPNSHSALAKLVEANPFDCWLLVLANEPVKRWFLAHRIKCVVSGSCTPDLKLPFVDLDYRALCRHAVGQMLATGHRRLVFLREKANRSGLVESERGFLEGVAGAMRGGVDGKIVYHQGSITSIQNALKRLLDSGQPPSALLVSNPNHFLLALTYLNHRGIRVPSDVSMVCPDDDPFLSYVCPEPSRYVFNAHIFAKRLFRLIIQVSNNQLIARPDVRIMPAYVKGATLGRWTLTSP